MCGKGMWGSRRVELFVGSGAATGVVGVVTVVMSEQRGGGTGVMVRGRQAVGVMIPRRLAS